MTQVILNRRPVWTTVLPGVRIQFRPHEPADVIVARRAAGLAIQAGGEGDASALAGDAFTISIARSLALAWEGDLVDEAGKPLECTPDHVEALLRQKWPAFEAVDREVVAPILAEDEEKNGSSPSPNGTSEGAQATARPAGLSGAPRARTSKTTRKRTPAKSPGK